MAYGHVHLGENVQTFKSSPKFEIVDMVVLNIDENAYVASPDVRVNTEIWEASNLGKVNGKFSFSYNPQARNWKYGDTEVSIESYGISCTFITESPMKAGDTITVNRMGETATAENPSPDFQLDITLTRSGKTIVANCPLCKPSERRKIAENLLKSLSGYGYQPYHATGAEVNPLAELGDGVTVNGIFSGMYQQDLTFDQLMISDICAPYEEELESEYTYEDSHERTYRRKFADIAAEFEIHADEIAARVTREGTGEGFSWSLIETGFSVKAGSKVIFRVDKDGTYVDGKGKFTGEVTGSSFVGGSITIGSNFSVDENGYMECYGAEFHGDIYAENGYFNGTVRAGNIDYGGDAGYFNGEGITTDTIGTARLTQGIRTTLANADTLAGILLYDNGRLESLSTAYLYCSYIYMAGYELGFYSATVDGTTINYIGW